MRPVALRLVLAALAAAPLVSACAFGDRHVRLDYPPEGTERVEAVPASAKLGIRPLHVALFTDQRAERARIGEVRNGWGMHTADVVAANDVCEWVRKGVRAELERAGFEVVEDCPAAGGVELRGEVLRVHCDALFSYEAEVQLSAELVRDGVVLARYPASGKGSAGTNWGATEEGYGESLARALQAASVDLALQLRVAPKP